MKFNQNLLLILTVLFLSRCATTTKVSKKAITHNYFNLVFSPEQIQYEILNKVELTITPIDAAGLNKETFEAASRDGNYEKELASSIEKRSNELDELSKADRTFISGKINAIEAISKLEANNLIPASTAYQLKYRIWYGNEYGKNGTELTALSAVETSSDSFNPYQIDKKYLSVFKVTFENMGNEIEKVALNQLQVVSGEELLYPLAIEYFEDNLKDEPEKVKNAYRMNMPAELVLTPSQRITKFIAIPAINPKNEKLQIQLINDKQNVDFEFKVHALAESKNYLLESYEIIPSGLGYPIIDYLYYAVNFQDGVSFATIDNRIFVSDEKKSNLISVYAIAISSTNSKVKTAQKINFQLNEQDKNSILIEFKKASE